MEEGKSPLLRTLANPLCIQREIELPPFDEVAVCRLAEESPEEEE